MPESGWAESQPQQRSTFNGLDPLDRSCGWPRCCGWSPDTAALRQRGRPFALWTRAEEFSSCALEATSVLTSAEPSNFAGETPGRPRPRKNRPCHDPHFLVHLSRCESHAFIQTTTPERRRSHCAGRARRRREPGRRLPRHAVHRNPERFSELGNMDSGAQTKKSPWKSRSARLLAARARWRP